MDRPKAQRPGHRGALQGAWRATVPVEEADRTVQWFLTNDFDDDAASTYGSLIGSEELWLMEPQTEGVARYYARFGFSPQRTAKGARRT